MQTPRKSMSSLKTVVFHCFRWLTTAPACRLKTLKMPSCPFNKQNQDGRRSSMKFSTMGFRGEALASIACKSADWLLCRVDEASGSGKFHHVGKVG